MCTCVFSKKIYLGHITGVLGVSHRAIVLLADSRSTAHDLSNSCCLDRWVCPPKMTSFASCALSPTCTNLAAFSQDTYARPRHACTYPHMQTAPIMLVRRSIHLQVRRPPPGPVGADVRSDHATPNQTAPHHHHGNNNRMQRWWRPPRSTASCTCGPPRRTRSCTAWTGTRSRCTPSPSPRTATGSSREASTRPSRQGHHPIRGTTIVEFCR